MWLTMIERGFLASLGLAALARDQVAPAVDRLIERGQSTRARARTMFERLLACGEVERKPLTDRLALEVDRVLARSPFATRREMRSIDERLGALEESRR